MKNVAVVLALLSGADAFVPKSSLPMARTRLSMGIDTTGLLWTPPIKSGERDKVFGPLKDYCPDRYTVSRRKTRTVECGPIKFGSEHPLVRQTMATTDTRDVEATIAQVIRCADEGFDLVRITVQGMKEAEACHKIREGLFKKGYDIPLCADMHFQPKVAIKVAEAFEKIRINPGNFADGRKSFEEKIYESEEDYISERGYLVEAFVPLVEKCKELNRAMRIGTNHGSLSARVLSFYGDTPRGMVESAIEFADIARQVDYHNFVFSMKASNPLVMVQGYRLLAAEMDRLGWDYPLHLGVTEAGEGEDGRMKSAIGIGTLLSDGLGDTIRVSLTEDPEYEFTPCNRLAEIGKDVLSQGEKQEAVPKYVDTRDFTAFERAQGPIQDLLPCQEEGDEVDYRGLLHRDGSVLSVVTPAQLSKPDALYKQLGFKTAVGMPFKDIATSDSIVLTGAVPADDDKARTALRRMQEVGVGVILPWAAQAKAPVPNAVVLETLREHLARGEAGSVGLPEGAGRLALTVEGDETEEELAALAAIKPVMVFVSIKDDLSRLHGSRRVVETLKKSGTKLPLVHKYSAGKMEAYELALELGVAVGSLLIDGIGEGVVLEPAAGSEFDTDFLRTTSFGLLQGSRMRNTKTEFVSCPSCGRTLFDLQEVTAQISARTGHLPGVAIAIMGCIVNGPGEMADADFGYVGGSPGKVDLYVGKEVVKRGIPNEEACDALVQLIKDNGMWKEKEEEEEEGVVEEELVAA